ncbi:MAG: hypothetical protein KDB32_13700 [Planctomycetes bacterium]|nr:hypothetical protein [Planctomycetota bacterium]
MSQTTSSDPKSLTQAEPSVARPSVLVWSGVLMQVYLFVVVGIAAKRIW